jgi:hypothetical protein
MRYLLIPFVIGLVFPGNAFGDESNCVLRIRTVRTDGAKSIDVKEVGAPSRDACKAKAKEIEDESRKDSGIDKTAVTFSYREPHS